MGGGGVPGPEVRDGVEDDATKLTWSGGARSQSLTPPFGAPAPGVGQHGVGVRFDRGLPAWHGVPPPRRKQADVADPEATACPGM
jgi:hypothetical protein